MKNAAPIKDNHTTTNQKQAAPAEGTNEGRRYEQEAWGGKGERVKNN